MIKRKAYEKLEQWKENRLGQALLVTGARQVGKTFLIRKFAKENYKRFIEVNLVENPHIRESFDLAKNSEELLLLLSLTSDKKLVPNESLIFIDEVQESKEIVTAIKFLLEKSEYDYILSGSLLGVELEDIRSVPVGSLEVLEMYPLDFEEFIMAKGVPDEAIKIAEKCFQKKKAVPEYLHKKLLDLFHEYLIIGGMPEATQIFIDENNMQKVRRVQENIIAQYKRDISKYNKRDSLVIRDIFNLIPSELNQKNKRFKFRDLDVNGKFRSFDNKFVWLIEAGVALPAFVVSEPRYPLLLSKATNLFKFFMSDVGLLVSTFMKDLSLDILKKEKSINYGSIYENVIAQELKAHGFDLYYYNSSKIGEVDFLIERNDTEVLPLEIKSGKDYRRHRALNSLLNIKDYAIKEGMVLSNENVSKEKKITYLPIYMMMFL